MRHMKKKGISEDNEEKGREGRKEEGKVGIEVVEGKELR